MRLFESARPWEYRWRIPMLFLSQPALAALHFAMNGFRGVWYSPVFSLQIGVIATILAGCGLALRVWGTSSLTAAVVTGLTARNDRLVVSGPFALMRNPLYVGTLLIFAGFGAFFGWQWMLLFVLFHWLRYNRVIRYEESVLRDEWGSEFDDYCGAVPRWLPNRLRRNFLTGPFVTVDGLIGNAVFAGIFVGFALSAWWGTLDPLVVFETLGWSVSLWVLLKSQAAMRQSSESEPPNQSVSPSNSDDDLTDQSRRAGQTPLKSSPHFDC